MTNGIPGVVHGMRSRVPPGRGGSDPRGQVDLGRSRLPGDRARARPPGGLGRAEYPSAGDDEVLAAFRCWPGPRGSSRPSNRPTPWPGSSRRPAAIPRVHGVGDPVGPGRQGRGAGTRAHAVTGRDRRVRGTLETALGRRRDAGHKLLVPYVTGGLGPRLAGRRAGDRCRGGRRHRDRDSVLGPGHGRARHPAGFRRGAEVRCHTVGDHRGVGTVRTRVSPGRDDVLQRRVQGGAPPDGRDARGRWSLRRPLCRTSPSTSSTVGEKKLKGSGCETVLLVAPTTPERRLGAICARSRGFVYGVGVMGVTGERRVGVSERADSRPRAARTRRTPRCSLASGSPMRSRLERLSQSQMAWWSDPRSSIGSSSGAGPKGAAAFVAELRAAIDR